MNSESDPFRFQPVPPLKNRPSPDNRDQATEPAQSPKDGEPPALAHVRNPLSEPPLFSQRKLATVALLLTAVPCFVGSYLLWRLFDSFSVALPFLLLFCFLLFAGLGMLRTTAPPERVAKQAKSIAQGLVFLSAGIIGLILIDLSSNRATLSIGIEIGLALAAIYALPISAVIWGIASRQLRREIRRSAESDLIQLLQSKMLMRDEERIADGIFKSLVLSVENGPKFPIVALLTSKRLLAYRVERPKDPSGAVLYELDCSLMKVVRETDALLIEHQGAVFRIEGDPAEIKEMHEKLLSEVWYVGSNTKS